MSVAEKIVVTGAAGFIGSHLCSRLLESGAEVVGVDNFDPFYSRDRKEQNARPLLSRGMKLIEADICDSARMRNVMSEHQPTLVYHIAALAGVRPSIAAPAKYAQVNVEGLVNVLEAMHGAGCGAMVFASSSSVYGNNLKAPFGEDDPVNEPISPYAATKRAGELICSTYAKLYGMRIAGLRFFTVFGPRQRPDLAIAMFMRKIANGTPIEMFGDGTTARDYTYIDDIVAGVLSAGALARNHLNSGGGWWRIYNLGGSHPVLLKDMIAKIAAVVGKDAKVVRKNMQPGDVERTFADVNRARAELGFEAKIGFEEGLKRQWEWMRTQV
ncbi:MAG TPA: NAD-dependent epimerase/dehydratase family protein [Phycisphaerales bacterium]|nr:NAD-dependent epimerase/dehydratase family protein [Phycisphaerales bacterium]